MKRKLIVLYEENKSDPKNTWSGTSYQLRNSLNNYFDVVFIDSSDTKLLKGIKYISKVIEKKTYSILFKPMYEKMHSYLINRRLRKYKDIPVLEICENVIINNPFYLYRDMAYACYPYVIDKTNNNENYDKSMLRNISEKSLNNRIKNEILLSSKAKKTFFMGNWVAAKMKELYPNLENKFIAVGGGLNNEFNNYSSKKDYSKKILFVGIDFRRKGGYLLIEAFKILKEKYDNDAELIIAGCEIKENYRGIRVVGKKTREELSALFQEADVFCMPSIFEAYGLVFIEALSFGLPVVSIDDYEMHYFINDNNGCLIKDYDKNELAIALHNVLNNEKMRENVRKESNNIRKYYSWDNVSNLIFQEIINDDL